jgi:hypothetical protein
MGLVVSKKKTLETLNTFGFQMVNFDANKITTGEASPFASD